MRLTLASCIYTVGIFNTLNEQKVSMGKKIVTGLQITVFKNQENKPLIFNTFFKQDLEM
jgi:hypothetical protein